MRTVPAAAVALVPLAVILAVPAHAIPIDGHRDDTYGSALSVQTTQTSFVDALTAYPAPDARLSLGSELDAAYAFIDGDVLHLMLTGNLGFCCPWDFNHQESVHLFLDHGDGGQHVLRADNSSARSPDELAPLAGLTFDEGFAADHWLAVTVNVATTMAALPAASGASAAFVGYDDGTGGGVLAGGANPHGILAALDGTNLAGVTQGCGAADGSGVETGLELAIPLAALGSPTGCIKVCAFITYCGTSYIGNQCLGPLPPGTCALGAAAAVDLGAIAGEQWFSVCPASVPADRTTWGRLKVRYR